MTTRFLLALLGTLLAISALALYDPKPDAALSSVQGEWSGSLTYRDYSHPDKLVTLPTKLFVALGAPESLVLDYIFDDGPNKTVFSYECMDFDFTNQVIRWSSGVGEKSTNRYTITTNILDGATRTLAFERQEGKTLDKFVMELDSRSLKLKKDEVDESGKTTFRNKFEFTRPKS